MATRSALDPAIQYEVEQFLYHEADLLDRGCFDDWLQLLADDLEYRMPVRTTRARASGDGFDDSMGFFSEDHASMTLRVKRLDTDFAWAEDPPSRTRRFVTNVRVELGDVDGELVVRSNVLLYRTRTDSAAPDLFSYAREDTVRDLGGRYLIARRVARIDQTILGAHNLSVFF